MKTIIQSLLDDVHYPLGRGFAENKLMARGLNAEDTITAETMNGTAYKGALADCLASLVYAPNFSESDKSVSFTDRDSIIRWTAQLYRAIGEGAKADALTLKPSVQIMD